MSDHSNADKWVAIRQAIGAAVFIAYAVRHFSFRFTTSLTYSLESRKIAKPFKMSRNSQQRCTWWAWQVPIRRFRVAEHELLPNRHIPGSYFVLGDGSPYRTQWGLHISRLDR
jgi:hypothetical protein